MANNFKKYQGNKIDTSVVEAKFKKSPFTVYKPVVQQDTTINNVATMQQANQYNQNLQNNQQYKEVEQLLPSVINFKKEDDNKVEVVEEVEEDKGNFFERTRDTLRDFGTSIEQGLIGGVEGVIDWGAELLGMIGAGAVQKFGDVYGEDEYTGVDNRYKTASRIRKATENFIKRDLKKEFTNTKLYNFYYDPLGQARGEYNKGNNALKKIQEQSYISEMGESGQNVVRGIGEGIGQMLPAVATGGTLGSVYFFTSAAGGGMEEALNQGADYFDAKTYGYLSGMTETAIESLFGVGGNILGKGTTSALSKTGSSVAAKLVTNPIIKVAGNAIGEGVEEIGSELINPYLKQITFDPDAPTASNEEILQSFLIGAAVGGIMGTAGELSGDFNSQVEEIDKLIDLQTEAYNKGRFADASSIAKMIETKSARLGEALQNNPEMQKLIKTTQSISKVVALNEVANKTDLSKYQDTYTKLQDMISEDLQQMKKEERAEFIKQNKLDFMYTKQGKLKANFAKLTTEQQKEAIKVVKNVSELDSDVKFEFFNNKTGVNGYYSKAENKIYINFSADNPYRSVGIHEFTHSLEGSKSYNNLRDFIIQNLKKQNKYASEFKKIKSRYKEKFNETGKVVNLKSKLQKGEITQQEYYDQYNNMLRNYVEEEMVAITISEEIFTDENTINELVGKNESLGKRILKWINNKIKGTEPEFNAWRKELKTAKKLYQKAINEKKASVEEERKLKIKVDSDKVQKYSEKERKYSLKKNESDEIFSDEEFDEIYDQLLEDEIEEDSEDLYYSGEVDVKGRELTDEQQMYFRLNHPYMFDEKGRLKVLYHGTKGAGFTVFDPRTSDIGNYRFGKAVVNFFTDSLYMSSSYTESGDQEIFNFNNRTFEQVKKDIEIYSKFGGQPLTLKYGKDLDIKNNNIEKNKLYFEDQFGLVYTGPFENLEEVKTEGMRFLRDTFGLLDEENASFDTINQYLHQGEIYEVYARIQNPFIVDGESRMWNNIINPFKSEFDKISKINFEELEQKVNSSNVKNYKDLEKYLSDNGIEFVTEVLDLNEMFEVEDETQIENKEVRIKLKLFDTVYMFTSYLRIEKNGKNINKNFNMKKEELIEQIQNKIQYVTTNDIVSKVLEINRKEGNTYDGIIIKKIYDYGKIGHMMLGNPEDVFITVESENQIKSVDNKNPTYKNKDIRYSLKEKKPREPRVESTKDIPADYVTGKAEAKQDKVYSKQEATEIYEELIHGIATEQGIAIDNDVEKKAINYIFQQLNSDKMTSSKIADKILDFVFKKTPGFKNSIPVDFRENIINDFRAFIFTQALEGGKESFRNRMVNKVQSLKQEVKYYKDLYTKSKRVMKKVEKLREFASRDYRYTPDAEVIADMLTKAATLLRKITIDNFNKHQTREIINDFKRDWYNRGNELIDVDPEVEAEFKKITDNIGSKEKLSLEEISALNNILSYMIKYINEYDKVRINGKEQKVTELAKEGISKVQSAKPLKTTKFSELYRKIVVKPSTYFRSIEGTVLNEEGILDTLLVKEIRRSETKFYENVMRLNQPFENFFKNNKKYRKELSSKKLQLQGKNITLREAITIQMLSLRQQARGHFMSDVDKNAKGLRIYDDNAKTFTDFILTQADVDALYEQFTDTDKQYMELVHNLFNVAARELKIETDMLLLGSTNIMEENYFPIIVDKKIYYKNLGDPKSKNLDSLFGLSFNEDTVQGANNRIDVMGVDTMVFSHIQKVSRYNAYMIPVKNIRQVLNKQFIVNSENKDRKSMLQFIEEKNPGFEKYLDKWLVDSVTSVRITSDEGKFLANIRKHYASYVLGLKFSTVVNQFTIIPTAINVLSPKSVLAATYTKLGKTGNLMDEYCPYVKHRNYSGSVKSSEINVESSLNSLQDRFLWFMSAGDRTTIKFIWRAAQIEAKSRYGYEFGTEENLKKAGELLEETIRTTQATDTSEQPEIQRTENEIVKTLLLFSKQNTQTISTITDYIAQYQTVKSRPQTEETKAKLKEINKKGAKAISGLLASSLAFTLVAYAFKHLLDKDDEEKNDWLELGSDFAGNVIGMVPLLGDVYSKFFEGYDMSLSVLDMFNDVSDAITGLYNAITTGNYQNSWYKFANAFGMATGIPTKNILEYGNAIIRVFNPDLAYKYKSIWYNQTVSEYTEDLEKSIKNKNKKTTLSLVKQIYAEKNIDLNEDLTSRLFPLFMSSEVENKASLFPKTANQTVTYDSEEYEMSDKQYRQFKKLYSQNLNKYIKSVTSNTRYTQLSAAEKAQAIKYMQDYAYFTSLSKILNINTIEATKVTILGNAINPSLVSQVLAKCRGSLKGKKAEIQRYINSIPGITREQKYLLYGMLGYKPLQDNAYVQVSNYLATKGYSIQEIHTILVKCKFIEDDEE